MCNSVFKSLIGNFLVQCILKFKQTIYPFSKFVIIHYYCKFLLIVSNFDSYFDYIYFIK